MQSKIRYNTHFLYCSSSCSFTEIMTPSHSTPKRNVVNISPTSSQNQAESIENVLIES